MSCDSTKSIWQERSERPQFQTLEGNRKTDVLIVGGGMTGILSAYMLREAGVDCMLVEADRICSGTTGNTTAKITYAHGLIYGKLISRFGREQAALYLEAHRQALKKYAELCGKHPCDYSAADSYVYTLRGRDKIEREIQALRALGSEADFVESLPLPVEAVGAVKVPGQAHFNPLKFAFSIAKGLPIYENTKVWELTPKEAITNRGKICYEKLIVATHFPILNKHGLYPLKMYQHRSYSVALENAPLPRGVYVDESDRGLSFRSYGNLLLLGGGGHRTGKGGGGWQELEDFAKSNYKGSKIVTKWAAQDCMTLDRVPYIGQYSKHTPSVYVATGFNKWGMSSAMVSACILRDLILGESNGFAQVFSPSRSMLRPQLLVNAFESVIGLITPTKPRCPHLGCALKYNSAERSWDCPCHGSRFTEDGKLIENPATDDKKL